MSAPLDNSTCPLCSKDNACAMARGEKQCWCFHEKIPQSLLDRVPAEAKNRSCICKNCVNAAAPKRDVER